MESQIISESEIQHELDLGVLGGAASSTRSLVSLVVPAFNEEAILEANLAELTAYLDSLGGRFDWELVLVDDGSSDGTAAIADACGARDPRVRVAHHPTNMGLCAALKTGFTLSRGDYVVTLDVDLSYAPEHIGAMLDELLRTGAKVVLASPYMEGGEVSNVPFRRALTSRWANRFLRAVAPENISTFTGMVRAFDGRFIRSLDLKAKGMDVNPEIVYKAMILRAKIAEVPAHLCWRDAAAAGAAAGGTAPRRQSSMHMPWQTLAILFSGFVFRPFLFFLVPGAVLLLLSLYTVMHIFIHIGGAFSRLPEQGLWFLGRLSASVEAAYADFPHTFFVGGIGTVISIQLLSLGFVSMQSKRYFEELYHLGSSTYRACRNPR